MINKIFKIDDGNMPQYTFKDFWFVLTHPVHRKNSKLASRVTDAHHAFVSVYQGF